MSVWNERNLINELLKHGEEFERKFTRHGQAAVDANAALAQILERLEHQLNPASRDPSAPPEISTQSDQAAVLNSTALESLGALVSFLAQNTITVNGQRVAYTENPQNEKYQFVQMEGNALYNETPDRQTQTRGFYVDMDLLKQYLNSLLGQLHQKPNPVMQVQVSKIIDEANETLDTGLGKTYQPPAASLPDNQVLDNVPKDFKKGLPSGPGNVPLTFADIKSIQEFNGWLSDNGISMDGRMINHPQFDKCGVVNVLHTRAKQMLSNARDDKQKNMYTLYVQNVEKLSSSIEGCSIGGATQSGAGQSGQGAGAGSGAASVSEVLGHLQTAMPLAMSDIDFGRIRGFFQEYRKILSPQAVNIASAMNNAETAMQQASQLTETGMDNFPLSATVQQVGTWLVQPKGQTQGFGLIAQLRYVISNTSAVLSHLKTTYGQAYPQILSVVNTQVGDDANSQGIAGNNLNHLQIWYNQFQSQSAPKAPGRYKGW